VGQKRGCGGVEVGSRTALTQNGQLSGLRKNHAVWLCRGRVKKRVCAEILCGKRNGGKRLGRKRMIELMKRISKLGQKNYFESATSNNTVVVKTSNVLRKQGITQESDSRRRIRSVGLAENFPKDLRTFAILPAGRKINGIEPGQKKKIACQSIVLERKKRASEITAQ